MLVYYKLCYKLNKKIRIKICLNGPQVYGKTDLFSNKTYGLLYNLRCKSVPGVLQYMPI